MTFDRSGGVVVDLLVRAGRQEARERMDDRHLALEGERPGLRDHVLLGDAALDEPLRELARGTAACRSRPSGRRRARRRSGCHAAECSELVRVRGDQALRSPRERSARDRDVVEGQRLRPGTCERGIDSLPELLERCAVQLADGRAAVEARTARRARARSGSMNDTPLPLTVSAMSSRGRRPGRGQASEGGLDRRRSRGRRSGRPPSRTRRSLPRGRRAD